MTDLRFTGPLICGVDFSDRSRVALSAARSLAERLDSSVIAVTAVDELLARAADLKYGAGRLVDETRRDLETFVAETAAEFGAGIDVRAGVGSPATVLHDVARETAAVMIVVGSRGHGPAGRLWFGSTTSRLLSDTTVPVLAVSGESSARPDGTTAPPLAFDQIVCGVDFGAPSIAAAHLAAALGRRLGTRVTLIVGIPLPSGPPSWREAVQHRALEMTDRARVEVEALARDLPGPPETRVTAGGAADVLMEAVEGSGRGLLVVGIGGGDTHRPGSTATKLLADGGAPVLAVPRGVGVTA